MCNLELKSEKSTYHTIDYLTTIFGNVSVNTRPAQPHAIQHVLDNQL